MFIPTDKYLLLGKTEFLRQFPSLVDDVFGVMFSGLIFVSDDVFKASRVEFSE